jgi:hypothetical protein
VGAVPELVEWWRTKPGIPTQNSVQQNLQKEAAAAVTQKHNAGQQGYCLGPLVLVVIGRLHRLLQILIQYSTVLRTEHIIHII